MTSESPTFVSLMYHNVVVDNADATAGLRLDRLSPSITEYFVTRNQFADQLATLARSALPANPELIGQVFQDRIKSMRFTSRDASLDDQQPSGHGPAYPSGNSSSSETQTHATTTNSQARSNEQRQPAKRNYVQLTFDDGWKDSVHQADEILAEHGWHAWLFVTTGFIGEPGFLSDEDLWNLDRNRWTIGGHSVSHRFLNELNDDEIVRELSESKAALERITGDAIDTVSIPNGAIDGRVRLIASELGYRQVYTSDVRLNSTRTSPFDIGRVAIRRKTTSNEIAQFAAGKLGKQHWRTRCLTVAKKILGPARYRRWRCRVLGESDSQFDMQHLQTLTTNEQPVGTGGA